MSAGPGNRDKTISEEDFAKAVDNLTLPRGEYFDLTLTGGEIFTLPNLYNYLDIIKDSKKEIRLTLQTNGFWGEKSMIKSHLEKLVNYNISEFDISSEDRWHREQGHKFQHGTNILHNKGKYWAVFIRGADRMVMPVGRAKPKSVKEYKKYDCFETCKNNDGLTINWKGQVSLCCYGLFKLKGNLIEQPLSEIIKKNRGDEVLKRIKSRGVEEIARFYKVSEKNINEKIKSLGVGGFCAYLFNKRIIEKKYRIESGNDK